MSELSIIPSRCLSDKRLDSMAVLVLCSVCCYTNTKTAECYPSQITIANKLGIARETVNRKISLLVDTNYLEKKNRGANKTCLYRVLYDDVEFEGNEECDSQVTPIDRSVTELSHEESDTALSHKRLFLTSEKKKPSLSTSKTAVWKIAQAVADASRMELSLCKSRLFKVANTLHAQGKTPVQVRQIFGEDGRWYSEDWRGQKGSPPTPEQILLEWKKLEFTGNPVVVASDGGMYL
jgi:DNA-binding transcriptional MocR family regulator